MTEDVDRLESFHVLLDPETAARLRSAAKRMGVGVSPMARMIFREWARAQPEPSSTVTA